MSDPTPSQPAKGALTANKRSPAQKAADALFIERLHLRGKTTREIAELLSKERAGLYSLSHQQVAIDLKKIGERWKEEATKLRGHEKEKALRKLDMLESELWVEWDKSKVSQTRTSLRKKTKATGSAATGAAAAADEEKSAVTTSSVGDPAIARAILEIHRERSKLLGLDAPTKHEHTGADGGPIATVNADVPVNEKDAEALLQRHFMRMLEEREEAQKANAADSPAPAAQDPA